MDSPSARRKVVASLLLLSPGLVFSAYLALRRAGMSFLYKPVSLSNAQVLKDVCYVEGSEDPKHRLDLFLPEGTGFPLLIFIHGGALTTGDKCLRVSGVDVYGNIGRFYASQGIGVALINYRLQPKVTWREQVDDAALATAWLYSRLDDYGADRERFYIGGHSAGAHLAARLALDQRPLAKHFLSPQIFSGVIAVSGAAFDLADEETYTLSHSLYRYEARFRCGDTTDCWKKEASPIACVTPGAPPFLIIYSEGETRSLQRQSNLLHQALQQNRVPSELVVVPGESHCRIVLTLSRPDKISGPAILRFINGNRLA